MPKDQKLTKVIAGRTVKDATVDPCGVLVLFDDQSRMKIKTVGPATIPPGGNVKSVHEAKTDFKIEFEDGSSATYRGFQCPHIRAKGCGEIGCCEIGCCGTT